MGGATHSFGLSMDTVRPGQAAGCRSTGSACWAGAVTVASTTPAATKRIANNDYVVPASPGIPMWAIALIVLGALILVSIWAVFLRRERNKNLGNPAG